MRYAISAMVLAVLSGCASTAKWQHPARAGDGHDGATMALAECESYAAGRTPMPKLQAYMPAPAPTAYNTTGTISSYGNVSTFQGTTTPSGGLASGYATGANMGANIANAYAVSAARQREAELTGACMRTQGWIDTSTPEGQEKFRVASAQRQAPKGQATEQSATREWATAVSTFLDTEAARPGGIDYRADAVKQAALDRYVKELANDPKNDHQKMSWFLIEAHKRVLADISSSAK